MVSASSLLQVLSRLIKSPQPAFTEAHARMVFGFLNNFDVNKRSRTDTLNMMNIAANCPHASFLYVHHKKICERTLTSFLVDDQIEDVEMEDSLRQVIRAVSVNNSLPTGLLLTMARRLTCGRRVETPLQSAYASNQDNELVDNLLRRVVSRMPNDGAAVHHGGVECAILSQKAIHKRKRMDVEKPELYFFVSTLRHVSTRRVNRALKDSEMSAISEMRSVPTDIVEPLIRCVESMPAFRTESAQVQYDDWVMMAQLIGCGDPRLHAFGRRLWLQKLHHQDPMKIISCKDDRSCLVVTLAGFLISLRGEAKRNAIELWIDIVTHPDTLSALRAKVLHLLIVDLGAYLHGIDVEEKRERVLVAVKGLIKALDASSSSSLSTNFYVSSRMFFTKVFPFLMTKEELKKTFEGLKKALVSGENLECNFIRDSSDFLRYLRRVPEVDESTLNSSLKLLAECTLRILELPSLEGSHISAITYVLVMFAAMFRDIQYDELLSMKEGNELRGLIVQIVSSFLQQHSAHSDPFLASVLLQVMEFLDLASDTQYTLAVRELVLISLRSVVGKNREITQQTAQHCYDLVLRSIRFHVADNEVLKIALASLRHATDTQIIKSLSWEQRAATMERGTLLYREMSRSFSTSKEARKVGNHLLLVMVLVVSDKLTPHVAESHCQGHGGRKLSMILRRCASIVWTLAVRATISPIPHIPIDRYVNPLLRFAGKHWVSEVLSAGDQMVAVSTLRTPCVDEVLCHDLLDNMLPQLHRVVFAAFFDRVVFQANIRRNKAIISTACEILEKNSTFLSPCVWYETQRILTSLPTILPGQYTPLHSRVLQAALNHTLRNVQACGNLGTWHLWGIHQKKRSEDKEKGEHEEILDLKMVADMFCCSDLIDDVDMRVYLISLISEHLGKMEGDVEEREKEVFASHKKQQTFSLNKIITTLRRGSVLYY